MYKNSKINMESLINSDFFLGENMKINNQEINIDDLLDQKYMHKEIKKGIFLSEYQIEVLLRYGIDVNKCSSINDIIFLATEILEDDPDASDLDGVINEMSEFNYYSNTNK